MDTDSLGAGIEFAIFLGMVLFGAWVIYQGLRLESVVVVGLGIGFVGVPVYLRYG